MATVQETLEKNVAFEIQVPINAKTVTVDCVAGTRDGEQAERFVEVPASLADAVAIYGERAVFKRFINSLMIKLQGETRRVLHVGNGEKKPRGRKPDYLDRLGLS